VINTRIEPPTEERFYLGSDTLQVPTRKVSVQLESGQWIFPKLEQSAAREWSVPRALVSTYDVSKTPTLSAPTLLELTRLIKEDIKELNSLGAAAYVEKYFPTTQ
jgi:hypothetical protein